MKAVRAVQAVGLVVLLLAAFLLTPVVEDWAGLHFLSIYGLLFKSVLFFLFGVLLSAHRYVGDRQFKLHIVYIAVEITLIALVALCFWWQYNDFAVDALSVLIGYLLPNCLFSGKERT